MIKREDATPKLIISNLAFKRPNKQYRILISQQFRNRFNIRFLEPRLDDNLAPLRFRYPAVTQPPYIAISNLRHTLTLKPLVYDFSKSISIIPPHS